MEKTSRIRRDSNVKFKPIKHFAWVVLESMRDPILVADPEGFLCYLNQSAEELLGVTFSKCFGHHITHVLPVQRVGASPPSRDTAGEAEPTHSFQAEDFNGFFQLKSKNSNGHFVHISTSTIQEGSESPENLLLTLRLLPQENPLTRAFTPRFNTDTFTTVEDFQERLSTASSRSRKTGSHGLLFIKIRETLERFGKPSSQSAPAEKVEDVVRIVQHQVRSTDYLCRLDQRTLCLLLEDCSLSDSTRMGLKLINGVRDGFTTGDQDTSALNLSICVVTVGPNQEDYAAHHLTDLAKMAGAETEGVGSSSLHVYEISHRQTDPSQEIVELVQ